VDNDTYAFRLRFRLSASSFIDNHEHSVTLFESNEAEISLRAVGSESIRRSRDLVVTGRPYDNEAEARSRGEAWQHTLVRALASLRVGADFGERGSLGWVNTDLLSRRSGTRILQDKLGVSVYREQPTPHFVGVGQPTLSVGKNSNAFIEAVDKASEVSEGLGEPILIAYYLFSASTSEQEIEARFILLVMALETMVDQQDRSALVRGHVDQLCELTKQNSNLLDEEKTSLLSALRRLKQESIGESGKRTVGILGSSIYAGRTPEQFFSQCYSLRSMWVPDNLSGVFRIFCPIDEVPSSRSRRQGRGVVSASTGRRER
jgi:hypothetical protein